MKICTFQKKVQQVIYQGGGNICPPSKIINMKYLLILLGRMFLTLKHAVINIYKYSVKTMF